MKINSLNPSFGSKFLVDGNKIVKKDDANQYFAFGLLTGMAKNSADIYVKAAVNDFNGKYVFDIPDSSDDEAKSTLDEANIDFEIIG